jgi:hypothetical protein
MTLVAMSDVDYTSPVAMRFNAPLTFDRWTQIGETLFHMLDGVQWWLGDWWSYGERHYGEHAPQALPLGYALHTVQNAAWVASRIDPARRVAGLKFSHHCEVAALEPAVQDAVLAKAASEQMTVREIREEVRALKPAPSRRREFPIVVELKGLVDALENALGRDDASAARTVLAEIRKVALAAMIAKEAQ